MKYLIIGNSTAAVGGIEGIRSLDKAGEITVISEEKHFTYCRPLISYLLEGKTNLRRIRYRPDTFYEAMSVRVLYETHAEGLDHEARTVSTSGETLAYDRLLISTGAKPVMPRIPGLELVANRFTFQTLDDALSLREAIKPESRVLIIGAGLIGLKCAEGLRMLVQCITVVERAEQILPSVLDDGAALRMQAHLEKNGIAFRLGHTVERFEPGLAWLEDGNAEEFDVLVIAAGVTPNVALIENVGGAIDRGIVADENGRTSLPDVYAAGDCVQSLDLVTGERRALAILPNAYQQGFAAGVAMAGGTCPFDKAIAMNALCFMGLHALTAGAYRGEAHEIITETTYKKLFVEDGFLKGFILLGDVDRAGIYTALIRERVLLSTLNFQLIIEKPQLMAFSSATRVQRLGAAVS